VRDFFSDDLYVLNDAGEPVPAASVLTWGRWLQTHGRHIAEDFFLNGQIRISTLFMGVDLRILPVPGQPPLLFETMVFGGPLHLEKQRYASRAEAAAGHAAIVEAVKMLLHQ
jgi:hypothetical protein